MGGTSRVETTGAACSRRITQKPLARFRGWLSFFFLLFSFCFWFFTLSAAVFLMMGFGVSHTAPGFFLVAFSFLFLLFYGWHWITSKAIFALFLLSQLKRNCVQVDTKRIFHTGSYLSVGACVFLCWIEE